MSIASTAKGGEWITYINSKEQIMQLNDAIATHKGVFLRLRSGSSLIVSCNLHAYDFDKYLICNPHTYSDMICQWAKTGQHVWAREIIAKKDWVLCDEYFPPFSHPNEFEYRFDNFEEGE